MTFFKYKNTTHTLSDSDKHAETGLRDSKVYTPNRVRLAANTITSSKIANKIALQSKEALFEAIRSISKGKPHPH